MARAVGAAPVGCGAARAVRVAFERAARRVGHRAGEQAARRELDVDVVVHVRGVLAAELEGDRREVLRRRGVHLPAHRRGARVEDVVEALREQRRADGGPSLDDGDARGVEVLRDEAGQERAARGRLLRRLQQHAVPGRERGGHRRQREREREVPRRQDQHDALRLRLPVGARREERERRRDGLAPGEGRQLALERRELGQHRRRLHVDRLEGRAPQVLRGGRRKRVARAAHQLAEAGELTQAPR